MGAMRPPNTIIPDMNEKLVKYSCFNVLGVYFKRMDRLVRYCRRYIENMAMLWKIKEWILVELHLVKV